MLESRIASTDSHLSQVSCRLPKRPSPSGTTTLLKRLKNDECLLHEPFDSSNSNPTDTESKSSSSDMDDIPEQCDDTSDMEECDEDATTATDQSEYRPCVYSSTISRPVPTRYSKALLQQFHELRDQSSRKGIELTRCPDQIIEAKKSSWELSNSFQRTDLIKEGHAVLSDQAFPFYSLCYMCGSMGIDLIYCNSCCQAYHASCLNEFERPRLRPTPESWVCPNCHACHICGVSTKQTLPSSSSSSISCFDCKRNFHLRCLKPGHDEQQNRSRPEQRWFCPSCIKCDCGQPLKSTDENLLPRTKSAPCQQALMCPDCSNNLKLLRGKQSTKIEKCHLCQKFIGQFVTKPKPLFSLSLIGHQPRPVKHQLLQCTKCTHRFHPVCDGYLNEDVILLPSVTSISAGVVCSQCDPRGKETLQNSLMSYKIQVVQGTITSVSSILHILLSEESRLSDLHRYMSNLQQLHQSLDRSLNLHAFLNDLLIVVQYFLHHLDPCRWQAAIDACLARHCPWFQSTSFSSKSKTLICSSSMTSSSSPTVFHHRCSTNPSLDHTYSLTQDRLRSQANISQSHLLNSSDSLLNFIDQQMGEKSSWENLHQLDTRLCQLCQTYADQVSPNISRLIPIGLNQWVHVGCILPAYAKTLARPPYVLRQIHSMILRCQKNFTCDLCSKVGASVQCYIVDCPARFHCHCLEQYYATLNSSVQERWKMFHGLLPNLTTLCSKHNQTRNKDDGLDNDQINQLMHLPSINSSSAVYADLSNTPMELSLTDIHLCIGSLQIQSLGHFDYLLNMDADADDQNHRLYPADYRASRVFWSTNNAREKTIYHLRIHIEQTYHQEPSNHRVIEYPISDAQIRLDQLYQHCQNYFKKFPTRKSVPPLPTPPKSNPMVTNATRRTSVISTGRLRPRNNPGNPTRPAPGDEISEILSIDTKTLRNLFSQDSVKSSQLSRFARALVQALQHIDQSLPAAVKQEQQEPILSYYLSNQRSCPPEESAIDETVQVKAEQLLSPSSSPQKWKDSGLSSDAGYLPQIDGSLDESPTSPQVQSISKDDLIQSYQQWSRSKFGRVQFSITSYDGLEITGEDLDQVWSVVVDRVRACRDEMNLTHLPMSNKELNGHQIFGLTKSTVKTLLQRIYTSSDEGRTVLLPLSSSSSSAPSYLSKKKLSQKKSEAWNSRLTVYQRKHHRRQRFGWLENPHRKVEYAMKSFASDDALTHVRQILLQEASVGVRLLHLHYFSERALLVGSSSIHGCGLFTLVDLAEGQMVIEYTGEVVRPCLTDQREVENERKGVGCYMFTVDSMNVIDATHQGNKARFINHQCQPNCFAKTVLSAGVKHIIIYALMDITRGSELTYDYSFPEEEIKIPCHCGTSQCRTYLN